MPESEGRALISVSSNYRELAPDEIATVAAECAESWKDAAIPERQYESCVKGELEAYRRGWSVAAPYAALIKCLRRLPIGFIASKPSLLDVGASSGYYREVMKLAGFNFNYTALDYSEAFQMLAEKLYPGMRFKVGDARELPYKDNAFDVVLSGCVMLHVLDYESVVRETARVSSQYAIFSKTPVILNGDTTVYEKEAYGARCIEIHFGEAELIALFAKYGLALLWQEDVSAQKTLAHRTYLLKKA
jgi:2-polyprenyl-3-methyl-5-hydroxy-6-metoxy-1,4-benzoquinol methylase